ncbi:MAG: asparagine--tRNA ligase, partial [Verrucomicrobia bacterium]|nr:asparagine--tRNA ligase [Verrucomicrobiota bacterium]
MVKSLLAAEEACPLVRVQGWVRTKRDSKAFSFVEINDGSCLANIQVIVDATVPDYETSILPLRTGASIEVEGELVESQGKGQKWEMVAKSVIVHGNADEDYPLQKKGHNAEFLRSISHLRPRSNL